MRGYAGPYKPTAHLPISSTIIFQGIEYVIVKVNPKNYVIARHDGKQFRLNRYGSSIEHTGTDTAWYAEAMRARVATQVERSGHTADDESVGITPEGFPRFKAGQTVRITGRGAGRYEGAVGTIGRVNRARYAVVVPGTGPVNVPFAMTVLADAPAADSNALAVDQHPLVGTEFRYLIGDEKVLFKVTEVDGKVLTAVGQKDDFEANGQSIPSDYEGTERDFLTAEVQGILDFEAKWAALTKQEA
jgi:hypothetical protein